MHIGSHWDTVLQHIQYLYTTLSVYYNILLYYINNIALIWKFHSQTININVSSIHCRFNHIYHQAQKPIKTSLLKWWSTEWATCSESQCQSDPVYGHLRNTENEDWHIIGKYHDHDSNQARCNPQCITSLLQFCGRLSGWAWINLISDTVRLKNQITHHESIPLTLKLEVWFEHIKVLKATIFELVMQRALKCYIISLFTQLNVMEYFTGSVEIRKKVCSFDRRVIDHQWVFNWATNDRWGPCGLLLIQLLPKKQTNNKMDMTFGFSQMTLTWPKDWQQS